MAKPAKPKDLRALIDLTKTTQTLLMHYQSSLAPSSSNTSAPQPRENELPNPLDVIKATTTLLKSHTTTLSLLLITPPLTPSAIIAKIGDVSSSVLSGMVAAASYTPQAGQKDNIGNTMRVELRAQVRRLLGTWGDVLALLLRMAESTQSSQGNGAAKAKDTGPTESEKQDVLSATGVVWEACDALLKLCADGVVGLVVKKAEELRAVLLDAVEELKEWGEDIEDDDDDAEGSGDEDDGFGDEDDIFGASNKLGKDDKELKELLDTSVKKLKMVGMLYQALIKRRLKTYPTPTAATKAPTTIGATVTAGSSSKKLDDLLTILKTIPETVDDLASAFYDLDEDEARQTLEKCCGEAKSAVELVKQNWTGSDDEFTAWSGKWVSALEAA
ncbi:Nn.00g059380.m01.CDS01 [Neocucurbitaria sp. VM-36]